MGSLLRYAAKKMLIGVPVVIGLTVILFFLLMVLPGDPVSLIVPDRRNVPEWKIEEIRREWGLDQPLYLQYFYWLSHLVRGDLGVSFVSRTQVSSLIAQRLPYTLQITLTSLLLAYSFGIPLGVVAALKRGTKLESGLMGVSVFMYSMPRYWLGIIFMLVFGLYLKLLPISGIGSQFSMVLPMLTLALPSVASLARLMRTEMVEVLTEDYVRTAWAKGLPSSKVIWRHALRNALIPVVVMFFMDLPWLIGGAVIVESVFAWPGLGLLLYHSILNQDFPVAQAIIFFIALLTVICNILGDVLSAYLDPRIRVEKGP